MKSIALALLRIWRAIGAAPRRLLLEPLVRCSFSRCGKRFHMGENCDFRGIQNISVGNDVSFGPNTRIWTTGARVFIGNDVMFGPGVSIISGDHRIDIEGKPMRAVLPSEKLPENDQDIIIGNDVWIGANAVVLKGVCIPEGSVVAAGAVLTKSPSEQYCIWGGTPARLIGRRFHD